MRYFFVTLTIFFALAMNACASPRAPQTFEERVSFLVDELMFTGTLYLPQSDDPVPLVVVYHDASGGEASFPFYNHMKRDLPNAGIATFVFDRRGSNGQPGDFAAANFERLARDGIAAVQVLKRDPRIDARRIGAWGISQGGWIAPLATTLTDDFSFVVMVSGTAVRPSEQMSYAAGFHIREAGFSEGQVRQAQALRARLDAYFRNPTEAERAPLQAAIDSVRTEPWYEWAFLPNQGRVPEDVTTTNWYRVMDFEPRLTLSSVKVPLLAVFGRRDRWLPVDTSIERLRESVSAPGQLTLYVSEHSGHHMSGRAEAYDDRGENPVEAGYVTTMVSWIESLPR